MFERIDNVLRLVHDQNVNGKPIDFLTSPIILRRPSGQMATGDFVSQFMDMNDNSPGLQKGVTGIILAIMAEIRGLMPLTEEDLKNGRVEEVKKKRKRISTNEENI